MTASQARFRNKTAPFIPLAMALLFSSCRSLEPLDSKWLSVPQNGSGQMEDFSKSITSHLYENGLLVGAGNDEKYLYIFFSPDIRHYERLPSLASLTLWLDKTGGKAKDYGFIYTRAYFPEGIKINKPGREHEPAEQNPPRPDKPPARSEPLLQFIDGINNKQVYLASDGSEGPQVHFSSDWGDFVYAWRIPLRDEGREDISGLAARPGQAIGIGLCWESKALRDFNKSAGNESAGSGPEGAPPPGRGGRGGMGAGSPGPGADFVEPPGNRKIWLKITLARQ
jgi:hypothetical protein